MTKLHPKGTDAKILKKLADTINDLVGPWLRILLIIFSLAIYLVNKANEFLIKKCKPAWLRIIFMYLLILAILFITIGGVFIYENKEDPNEIAKLITLERNQSIKSLDFLGTLSNDCRYNNVTSAEKNYGNFIDSTTKLSVTVGLLHKMQSLATYCAVRQITAMANTLDNQEKNYCLYIPFTNNQITYKWKPFVINKIDSENEGYFLSIRRAIKSTISKNRSTNYNGDECSEELYFSP